MAIERTLDARARVHAALGDPSRLAIVDRLVPGDLSPGELAEMVNLPTNLLAHHLKVLELAGVVQRVRSEGDRRRAYVRLIPHAVVAPLPVDVRLAPRVVFVCTHNSARSQLAATAWAKASRVPVASAGTHPADRVHPAAVTLARRHRMPLRRVRTRHVDAVVRPDDLVVAVCDNAHEELGARAPDRLHWSVPDPVRIGTDDAFEHSFALIEDRIDRLAAAVHPFEEKPS
jgi:ArsR family transcriptional regulator, arsenate/arsenite/antimonite-responsive transcriptional repressor / arsenate reductase (thioredoxin)